MRKTVFLTLLILPLLTCRNPAALLDKLEDDVKSANGLYLEIVDVSPSENGLYINPGEDIRIEFDRAIDLSSVEDAFSVIDSDEILFGSDSNLKSLSYRFDENTNILTIKADPYLDGLKQYTVSILEKLRGRDGSALREPHSWSFSTSDAPRGYVEFEKEYNKSDKVSVNIYSQGASYITYSEDPDTLDWGTRDIQLTGNPHILDYTFEDTETEETKILYLQFRDGFVGQAGIANLSSVESDSTVFDKTPPTITFNSDFFRLSSYIPNRQLSIGVSDSLSGIDPSSYLCVSETATVLSNAATTYPTVTTPAGNGGVDNDYSVSFSVSDLAGNSSSELLTIIRDNDPPSPPDISAFPAANSDLNSSPLLDDKLVEAADADLSKTLFSVVNNHRTPSSWTSYAYEKSMPTMLYGSSTVYFRSIDLAGNYSEISRSYYVFPSSVTGEIPSSGGSLTSDMAWPASSKIYPAADYFRAYLSTSSRGPFTQIGTKGTYRSRPFVDATELSLSIFSTYYWYFDVYDYNLGKYSLLYTSPVFSFRASKF